MNRRNHFLRDDFIEKFVETRDDKEFQGDVIKMSNAFEKRSLAKDEFDDLER
ncbi:MAG: hypothetical protein SPK49_05070 [Erysipelotrichaceae bacterium]|nr:hypothetical protein [Erysipelotrichaceae bacterium]